MTMTSDKRSAEEVRRDNLAKAMRCQCRQFELELVDALTMQRAWTGEELERLADRIRRLAWARQRGEV